MGLVGLYLYENHKVKPRGKYTGVSGFLVVPNHGFSYLKMISTWSVKWGYHHLRRHPIPVPRIPPLGHGGSLPPWLSSGGVGRRCKARCFPNARGRRKSPTQTARDFLGGKFWTSPWGPTKREVVTCKSSRLKMSFRASFNTSLTSMFRKFWVGFPCQTTFWGDPVAINFA